MSKQTEKELRAAICDSTKCWRTQTFTDANVTANLKGSWRILLLDEHFATCAKDSKGKMCDGVATYPSNSNDRLKLLELKQTPEDYPHAAEQLLTGGTMVEKELPGGFSGLIVEAELHVRKAQTTTKKLRKELKLGKRKVPVRAFKNGKRV